MRIRIINFPQTTTILALGFLIANFLYTPMIAWIGEYVAEPYQDSVSTTAKLFSDGMLIILGYYFARAENARQERIIQNVIEGVSNGPGVSQSTDRNAGADADSGTQSASGISPDTWPFESSTGLGQEGQPGVQGEGVVDSRDSYASSR